MKIASGSPTYDHVVLGGTFDRLHDGHRKLISTALGLATKSLTIGVTDDSMAYLQGKKLREMIQPVEKRIEAVRVFLSTFGSTSVLATVIPNYKDYEVFLTEDSTRRLDCTVATPETIDVAEAANAHRKKKGLLPLNVHIIDSIRDEGGTLLSSTLARQKEAEPG